MKFNLGDKLVMKSGVNVRGLKDPRVRRARAKGRERRWKREKKNKINYNKLERTSGCMCMQQIWRGRMEDGGRVRDRQTWWGEWQSVTLLGFEAWCSAAAVIQPLTLLHGAVGGEALCDCIHIVKNRWRGRLCKQASFTRRRVLLIGDGFWHEENKVFVFSCCRWRSLKNKLQWKWQLLLSMRVIK